MRSILAVYLLAILLLGACRSGGFYTNPILSNGADPWIVRYDSNYYYCCVMPGNRIGVSKSQKLHQINGPIEVWKAPIGNKWIERCFSCCYYGFGFYRIKCICRNEYCKTVFGNSKNTNKDSFFTRIFV